MAALRKNSQTGLLLGVCSGISEWTCERNFCIPANVIRITFVIGFVLTIPFACIVGLVYLFLANTLTDTAYCNLPLMQPQAHPWRVLLNCVGIYLLGAVSTFLTLLYAVVQGGGHFNEPAEFWLLVWCGLLWPLWWLYAFVMLVILLSLGWRGGPIW